MASSIDSHGSRSLSLGKGHQHACGWFGKKWVESRFAVKAPGYRYAAVGTAAGIHLEGIASLAPTLERGWLPTAAFWSPLPSSLGTGIVCKFYRDEGKKMKRQRTEVLDALLTISFMPMVILSPFGPNLKDKYVGALSWVNNHPSELTVIPNWMPF